MPYSLQETVFGEPIKIIHGRHRRLGIGQTARTVYSLDRAQVLTQEVCEGFQPDARSIVDQATGAKRLIYVT